MNKLNKELKLFEIKNRLNELGYVNKLSEYGFDICGYRYPIIFKVNNQKLEKRTVGNRSNFNYKTIFNYEYIWFVDRLHYIEFLLHVSCMKNRAGESDCIKQAIKEFSCMFSEGLVEQEKELSADLFNLGPNILTENEDLEAYDMLKAEIIRLNKELEDLENENIKGSKETYRD